MVVVTLQPVSDAREPQIWGHLPWPGSFTALLGADLSTTATNKPLLCFKNGAHNAAKALFFVFGLKPGHRTSISSSAGSRHNVFPSRALAFIVGWPAASHPGVSRLPDSLPTPAPLRADASCRLAPGQELTDLRARTIVKQPAARCRHR